jgi:hypothetical protein
LAKDGLKDKKGATFIYPLRLLLKVLNLDFVLFLYISSALDGGSDGKAMNTHPSPILKRCAIFMNNAEEKYWFEKFKESYKGFPNGNIIHCDKPDFIIQSDRKAIGVEVTQIFKDNTIHSSLNAKRKESLNSMLGNALCDKLQLLIPRGFCLDIYWSKKGFSNCDIHRITEACVRQIKQLQYPTENYVSFDIVNNGQLPEEIMDISFMNFHHLDKPFFVISNSGIVGTLTTEHLKVVLDKKEKALKNYTDCSKFWLLIIEGSFLSDSFSEVNVQLPATTFSKVLIYRVAEKQVVQLK